MSESYLFDAGWLFFALWSAVVAVVSLAAFGSDLLRSKARLGPTTEDRAPAALQPLEPRGRS